MEKTTYFYRLLVVSLILFSSIIIGCAKPPTEEITKAEKAVEEARQKEADMYVPDIFAKAENSLKKSNDLVAAKKYKEAAAAEETIKFAQQAILLVEPNKAKMKEDAEKLIQEAQKEMDGLKTLAAKAIKKKAPINREKIQNMIGKWEVDIATIKDKLQSEQVKQAYDELKTMKEQVNTQKQGVEASLERLNQ